MPRKPLKKIIQQHLECACGYNSVEQFPYEHPLKDLKAVGTVRKIEPGVYSLHVKADECEYCNPGDYVFSGWSSLELNPIDHE